MSSVVEIIAEPLVLLGIGYGVSFWCYATYPQPAWWEGSVVGLIAFIAVGMRWVYVIFEGLRR